MSWRSHTPPCRRATYITAHSRQAIVDRLARARAPVPSFGYPADRCLPVSVTAGIEHQEYSRLSCAYTTAGQYQCVVLYWYCFCQVSGVRLSSSKSSTNRILTSWWRRHSKTTRRSFSRVTRDPLPTTPFSQKALNTKIRNLKFWKVNKNNFWKQFRFILP